MKTKLALLSIAFTTMTFRTASAAAFATPTQTPVPSPVERPAHRHGRGELGRFLKKLDVTDAQRQLVLDEARAAAPIAHDARVEGLRIRADAQRANPNDPAAARAAARPKLLDLRERTLDSLRPLARRVLASLSADQRKTIEDAARARGKTPSEDRLEKVVSWLLTRPAARIQKRQQR
jgi:hypothetical protein